MTAVTEHGESRVPARALPLLSLAPLLVLTAVVECAARLVRGHALTDTERHLVWVAGRRAAFPCSAEGECRTDAELVRLDVPESRFAREPRPGVFRVACVGDSTTRGWPYHPRGGYPEWLGALLADALPGREVEVLDLGVHAWDGERLEAVFEEALALAPGALLWRAGYNDHYHAPLRRPPGPVRAAAQRARLFLLERSAAFRLLSRGVAARPAGIVMQEAPSLDAAAEDALVAAHRARLRRLASRAASAGVPLFVLGLPHRPDFAPEHPALRALRRLEEATVEEAAAAGARFVRLDLRPAHRRFVDLVHSDLEGYRLTARQAARALAAAGVPAPAPAWRWERARPREAHARALGLDDAAFRARLGLRLAMTELDGGDARAARRHMAAAVAADPGGAIVGPELAHASVPGLSELYARARSRAGRR